MKNNIVEWILLLFMNANCMNCVGFFFFLFKRFYIVSDLYFVSCVVL